jgi:hypothetical protein
LISNTLKSQKLSRVAFKHARLIFHSNLCLIWSLFQNSEVLFIFFFFPKHQAVVIVVSNPLFS